MRISWALVAAALLCPRPSAAQSADEPAPRMSASGTSIEPYWLKKHEELTALARQGGAKVVFLGDSIMEYWRDNEVWRARYASLPAANFGVAGDVTQNVLWRLAQGELTGENPSVVVVLIGTNNLGKGDTPEEAALGATAVVRAVAGRFPAAKILLLGIFPRGARADDPYRERVRRANVSLSHLDNGSTVRYLDVGPRFLEPDGSLSPAVMPDFLHPSVEGYRRWADAMDPLLSRLLGR
ncbi:MAG TPA: GDSL-type esterase/lipase family protein [Elusimicrobiota bacterium]|nr:GDSL-type esterase/lipase family protein [Elusimicrobiota bacterium]